MEEISIASREVVVEVKLSSLLWGLGHSTQEGLARARVITAVQEP